MKLRIPYFPVAFGMSPLDLMNLILALFFLQPVADQIIYDYFFDPETLSYEVDILDSMEDVVQHEYIADTRHAMERRPSQCRGESSLYITDALYLIADSYHVLLS